MPQLNPAPWFLTFILVWITIFVLLKLMTALQNPASPTKHTPSHTTNAWTWVWL